LLVEAILSAVVIAVGLVFVSRGLSSQLKALRTVEEYEVLRSLAHGKLLELEGQRLSGSPPPLDPTGTFEEPYQAYRWTITARPRDDVTDQDGNPLASAVTVTVQQDNRPSSVVRLSAIWPMDWVVPAWF
jgi:hypothetical protein